MTWGRWPGHGARGHVPTPERTGRNGPAVLITPLGDGGPARDGSPLCLAGGPIRNLRPPGDDHALQAWAKLLVDGEVPTESLRFAAWVRMAPSTHTSAHAEFHCAYCSQPCKGWGDHMVRSCPVVLAAALTGFRAMCALLWSRGYAVCWCDSLGATVYNKAGRISHWRLARDEDVVVQSESAA